MQRVYAAFENRQQMVPNSLKKTCHLALKMTPSGNDAKLTLCETPHVFVAAYVAFLSRQEALHKGDSGGPKVLSNLLEHWLELPVGKAGEEPAPIAESVSESDRPRCNILFR